MVNVFQTTTEELDGTVSTAATGHHRRRRQARQGLHHGRLQGPPQRLRGEPVDASEGPRSHDGARIPAARRGSRGQTYTLGVMLPDIYNPFFSDIINGLTKQLHGTDYQVLLGPARHEFANESLVTEAMIDHSMDGLVLIVPTSAPAQLQHTATTVPTVVIGRHESSTVYDTVVDNDTAGAALVVDHLVGLGHRRIAHIEHAERERALVASMPNAIRARGYRQAMQNHGLDEFIDAIPTRYTREGGYLATKQLLARPERPTAIFAGADIAAMGVLEAVAEAGLHVPGDI